MRACLAVIRGNKPPSFARNAFISAAKDARILLDDLNNRSRTSHH
jgi:hypothetical protein